MNAHCFKVFEGRVICEKCADEKTVDPFRSCPFPTVLPQLLSCSDSSTSSGGRALSTAPHLERPPPSTLIHIKQEKHSDTSITDTRNESSENSSEGCTLNGASSISPLSPTKKRPTVENAATSTSTGASAGASAGTSTGTSTSVPRTAFVTAATGATDAGSSDVVNYVTPAPSPPLSLKRSRNSQKTPLVTQKQRMKRRSRGGIHALLSHALLHTPELADDITSTSNTTSNNIGMTITSSRDSSGGTTGSRNSTSVIRPKSKGPKEDSDTKSKRPKWTGWHTLTPEEEAARVPGLLERVEMFGELSTRATRSGSKVRGS